MSYDTENKNIFLQKVLTNVCKIKIKSNRLMKSESKVNGQMTACLFVKGKLVRHENSRERETDVASHWKFTSPKLRFKFRSDGGSNFTERDWINFIWKGSNKTIFQYCQNSCNKWLCIRAVRGHTGEEVFQLEILGHVRTPLNWKEFVFHQGCSSNVTFVLNGGRIAGERRSRHQTLGILHSTDGETKLKNFFMVIWRSPEKFSTQRAGSTLKTLFTGSILGRPKEEGISFWQTKSHATITYSTVPPDCIERVISQRGEKTIYQRSSTLRLAPRIVLRSTWHKQQQQQQQQDVLRSGGKLQRDTVRGPLPKQCCARGTRFMSISEFMEYHKTSSTKTRSGWPSCKIWLIDCKMDIASSPSSSITWNKSCTNLAKQSEQLSVLRVCDTVKKGQSTSDAVSVWYPRKNTQTESKVELTSLQTLISSSDEEEHVSAMDKKNGSIIGRPQMLLEIARREREYESIAKRWIEDPDYRDSQQEHGWTLECCMFLDYTKTIKINFKATRGERDRYKKQFVLRWKDLRNLGKMSIHEDFKEAVKSRATMALQQGRGNTKIPPSQRFRQRLVNEQLRSQLQWQCQQWRNIRGTQAPSSSSSSTTW